MTCLDDSSDAFYQEGKAAYRAGLARWENPYKFGSYAADDWDAGFAAEAAEHYN